MDIEKILNGDRLALARLITQIENQTESGLSVLDALFPYTGKAHLIGITGSPGAGKSSLVNSLVRHFLQECAGQSDRIAVVAVDPSSPFSGGALLGDRVRMRDLMSDPRIFIRSMASRGGLGGLAQTTGLVTQALDAAGFGTILIETVGAGQTEVEIARLAHTVIVVEAPGMGDDIQAIKAGILEIADILVVNKADHSGAENTVRALRSMLELARPEIGSAGHHGPQQGETVDSTAEQPAWLPPVVQTVATQGEGIDTLLEAIERHKTYLTASRQRAVIDRARLLNEMERLLKSRLYERWQASIPQEKVNAVFADLEKRNISPQTALKRLLDPSPRSDND